MKNPKLKKCFLIILFVFVFAVVFLLLWFSNRRTVFGTYQVKELVYINILSSASTDVWEKQYLDARVELSDNCMKLVNNQGQVNQVENPEYTIIQVAEDETGRQAYKDLFWGLEDAFVESIETSYEVEQASDKGTYFMIWEASDETYLVLYTRGKEKDFISLVAELEAE